MLDSVANLVCRSGNLYLEQSHPKFAKLLFSRYLLFRPALRHPSDFFTHCTQERDLTVIQCMILYINSSKHSPVLQRHSPSIGDISIRVHTTDDSCPTLKQRCTRQAHVVKLHVTHSSGVLFKLSRQDQCEPHVFKLCKFDRCLDLYSGSLDKVPLPTNSSRTLAASNNNWYCFPTAFTSIHFQLLSLSSEPQRKGPQSSAIRILRISRNLGIFGAIRVILSKYTQPEAPFKFGVQSLHNMYVQCDRSGINRWPIAFHPTPT